MAALRSGDHVMDGPASYTRVIINQHAAVNVESPLLEIAADVATITLTPDHVLSVDGKFVPAREAMVGSKLSGAAKVLSVSHKQGAVINPLTSSGKILTPGGILASTYPEWIAEYMLNSYLFPLPLSLSNVLSFIFPEAAQMFYDQLVESFVTAHHPMHLKAILPAPLIPVAFLLGDLAVAAGFVSFFLASPVALVAATAIVVSKARKCVPRK
jgi:hypothetical protein